MARFIPSDRDQPFLMPPDLRDWVPQDDLVHFIIAAVNRVSMSAFKVNTRGSGSAQYEPRMMVALLVYCYSQGVMSSRRIEKATHYDVRVRLVAANTHPDHDTIATFRRDNGPAFAVAFHEVLQLAMELKILKVGTISVDGSKFNANANIHKSVRYDRAVALREQLRLEIDDLLKQAEKADATPDVDPQILPKEIARRQDLQAKMNAACERLEKQAKERAVSEQADYEKRKKKHDDTGGGKPPSPPSVEPRPEEQTNLVDPESRIMRKNKRSEYRQAYNAQAGVDADGTQLILATGVTQSASDANELIPIVNEVERLVGKPETALVDTGYANGEAVAEIEERGTEVLVPIRGTAQRRQHDFRPPLPEKPVKEPKLPWMKTMKEKMATKAAKAKYKLRKQTVEPVFGIIKQGMGFRQFLLRGIDKVRIEFQLVALAYNCRRLHTLSLA